MTQATAPNDSPLAERRGECQLAWGEQSESPTRHRFRSPLGRRNVGICVLLRFTSLCSALRPDSDSGRWTVSRSAHEAPARPPLDHVPPRHQSSLLSMQ
jgi:hypothetical protein